MFIRVDLLIGKCNAITEMRTSWNFCEILQVFYNNNPFQLMSSGNSLAPSSPVTHFIIAQIIPYKQHTSFLNKYPSLPMNIS